MSENKVCVISETGTALLNDWVFGELLSARLYCERNIEKACTLIRTALFVSSVFRVLDKSMLHAFVMSVSGGVTDGKMKDFILKHLPEEICFEGVERCLRSIIETAMETKSPGKLNADDYEVLKSWCSSMEKKTEGDVRSMFSDFLALLDAVKKAGADADNKTVLEAMRKTSLTGGKTADEAFSSVMEYIRGCEMADKINEENERVPSEEKFMELEDFEYDDSDWESS